MLSNLDTSLLAVETVLPLAPYIGGKRNLAKRLIGRIAAVPHVTYAEVFVGMGGVFFRRDQRARAEVINDWSEDVSTFFRVVQRHYVPFMEMLRFQVTSRAGFEKLIALPPESLTDLERSARFLYLQRLAFGGKVRGRGFGVSPGTAARFDVSKLGPMIEAAHERLASVVIERLPWGDFITRYDRDGTLFYLDPPYFGCERDYGEGMFARDEFARMADLLRGIRGRFILSLNDNPEVRRIFAGFDIEEVGVRYTVGGQSNAQEAREVIVSNRGCLRRMEALRGAGAGARAPFSCEGDGRHDGWIGPGAAARRLGRRTYPHASPPPFRCRIYAARGVLTLPQSLIFCRVIRAEARNRANAFRRWWMHHCPVPEW